MNKFRNRHSLMFFKIIVPIKVLQILQESNCVGVFLNKVAGLQKCNFIKKRLQHRFLTVKFVNYPRTPTL